MPLHKNLTGTDLHNSKVTGTNDNIVSITDNVAVDSGIALADLDVGIFTRDDLTTTVTLFNSGDTVDLDGTLKTDTIDEHNAGSGVTVDGVLLKDNDVVADEVTVSDGKIYLSADDSIEWDDTDNAYYVKLLSFPLIDVGVSTRTARVGYRAGYEGSGIYPTQIGYYAGRYSIGDYPAQLGYRAGFYNKGANVTQFGVNCGYYSTGNEVAQIGYYAGQYNCGNYVSQVGLYAGRYNEQSNNVAIGYCSHCNFVEDTANNVNFDYTDVSSNNITLTAHGLGGAGTYRNLKFTQGTGTIGGLTDGSIYKFKIIDADTIQSFGFSLSSPTGTGHTLTPQFRYSNVTALGYNAEPDASNQVVLGDTNVTEVKSSGVGNFGGATLGDGGTTDYLSVASDGVVTLYGDARYDDCINITPGAVSAPGSGAATQVARGLDTAWEYADNLVRQTSVTTPLRPNMDRSVAPTLRVYWESPTTSATCKWQLDYIYRKANEDMSTTSGTTVSVDGTSSATANGLVYTDFTLATPDSDDIEIVMRLTRNGDAAGDTLGDSAYTHGWKIMYKANKL